MRAHDLAGQRFGRLTIVERQGSRHGKALWSCDCDCGTKGFLVTQNALARAWTRSCGCLRQEFLDLGLRQACTNPKLMPRAGVTYPIPEIIYPGKSDLVNGVARRRFQFRWERVELECRTMQHGKKGLPAEEKKRPVFTDDFGRRITPLDLGGMMEERRKAWQDSLRTPVPEIPASYLTPSSLADLVRVYSPEEWARL